MRQKPQNLWVGARGALGESQRPRLEKLPLLRRRRPTEQQHQRMRTRLAQNLDAAGADDEPGTRTRSSVQLEQIGPLETLPSLPPTVDRALRSGKKPPRTPAAQHQRAVLKSGGHGVRMWYLPGASAASVRHSPKKSRGLTRSTSQTMHHKRLRSEPGPEGKYLLVKKLLSARGVADVHH